MIPGPTASMLDKGESFPPLPHLSSNLNRTHKFGAQVQEKRKQLEAKELKEVQEAAEIRRNNLQYSGILIFIVFVFGGVFFF